MSPAREGNHTHIPPTWVGLPSTARRGSGQQKFEARCTDTYRLGRNRQWRRDVARLTRKKGAPRGPAPVPPQVLALAGRLRENALANPSDVQEPSTGVVLPADGGDDAERDDGGSDDVMPDLPRTPRLPWLRRGHARNLGRLGR